VARGLGVLLLFLGFVELVHAGLERRVELLDMADVSGKVAFADARMRTEMNLAARRNDDLNVVVKMQQAGRVNALEREVLLVRIDDLPSAELVDCRLSELE